jgi:hypothetical protein
MASQPMLRYLYDSGTAFFPHSTYPDFDIVASIRCSPEGTFQYGPLLVSVQALDAFCPGDTQDKCIAMENKMIKAGFHRAFGIVIVIGASVHSTDDSRTLKTKDVVELFDDDSFQTQMVMAKVLRVYKNDKFGISKAREAATLNHSEEKWEIFASQNFVQPLSDDQEP